MYYADFVFGKPLSEIDPAVSSLIRSEEERQTRKIILVPSESLCPSPVLEALGSSFNNIYAEGYPSGLMDGEDEDVILDLGFQLARYRRYADRRFYKGCEYANFLEALAGRRVARLFETERNPAENIYVNVQPLSGSAANNAVYEALLKPGDVVMGMSLMHGGHLTHGSEFNRSGKHYKIVSYGISNVTERLDYDEIMAAAKVYRPRLIIAGYTSYPWAPDWKKFRTIADEVGAFLLADVAHPAGLIVAGLYPNPVDYADVITFTTHKTLFGPRGAVIMTTRRELAERIDQAVFPGEQGGPHVNKFAAMAVAFRIAAGEEFKAVQRGIVKNAQHLGKVLIEKGLKLAYGGTDTHILLIDLKSVPAINGCTLKGDTAVRILDLVGIVANKNTIPGDIITAEASGVRIGTPWITQRGITEEGVEELGDIIAFLLKSIHPFSYIGLRGILPRGKIDFDILEEAKARVEALARSLRSENPWVWDSSKNRSIPSIEKNVHAVKNNKLNLADTGMVVVRGRRALQFLGGVLTCKVTEIDKSCGLKSFILDEDGRLIAPIILYRLEEKKDGENQFVLFLHYGLKKRVISWLEGLSDGYIIFDRNDIFRKIEGPVVVLDLEDLPDPERKLVESSIKKLIEKGTGIDGEFLKLEDGKDASQLYSSFPQFFDLSKPYFVGQHTIKFEVSSPEKKEFMFNERASEIKPSEIRKSCLYEEHLKLSAVMVEFAGWVLPLRYESTIEEHRAVRQNAGLFDVSHMGILEVSGRYAEDFLNAVTTNYVSWIKNGNSQYSYLLDPDGNVIDDIMVYRVSDERFILVVNALNSEKDFEWLKAVNSGQYLIDRNNLFSEVIPEVTLRDLKTGEVYGHKKGQNFFQGRDYEKSRDGLMVDIALQGPYSLDILRGLSPDDRVRSMLERLEKGEFIFTELGGFEMLLSRTGYTGEEIGFEMLFHPSEAPRLWELLLESGKPLGIKPVGLGARDSLRIEAGLPLYGHEIAGPLNISPVEAGFGPYVKFHKPFFIGREALLGRIPGMRRTVVRFRMLSKGVRVARQGDMVVSHRTQEIIGSVTSCAVNHEGFQIGMACVDARFSREGTPIAIVPAFRGGGEGKRTLGELSVGARFPLHEDAIVLSRFPSKE